MATSPEAVKQQYDVFVSYSHEDAHFVGPVVQAVRHFGKTKVFVDRDSIEPGDIWADSIRQAISGAKEFWLFWCCHARKSVEVQAEIKQAIEQERKVVPYLLCAEPVPPEIGERQWIDSRPGAAHDCKHSTPSRTSRPLTLKN